jgi:hypothetical protein
MRHAWPQSLSRVDLEFSIVGARREGEFVEGLTFLIAQMFGIVLWAWNRIHRARVAFHLPKTYA